MTANSVIKERNGSEFKEQELERGKVFTPPADIYESEQSIVVQASIPGADENSVDIMLEKNVLTINASAFSQKHEGFTLAYCEYPLGDFRRAFTLPNEIDREGIEAVVKNGVLKLTLPKSKESLPKKITVTGGDK